MELKDYLKILGKYIWFILIITVLVGVLSYYFSKNQKSTYSGYKTISISRSENALNNNFYQYDGYYSAEASAMQAKSLSSWLGSVASVTSIYQKAGETVPVVTDKNMKNIFTAKSDIDSSVVTVTMSDSDKSLLEKRLNVINELVDSYFQSSNKNNSYALKYSDNSVSEIKISIQSNTLAGVIAGLILGVIFAFALDYFKPRK